MKKLIICALFAWWFAMADSSHTISGNTSLVVGSTMGPFGSKAQCEEIKTEISKEFRYVFKTYCWETGGQIKKQ